MIGQIKGKVEQKVGERRRRKWKRERMQRRRKKKKSRAEAHGLEKLQVLRYLIDVEDGNVAVDLPNHQLSFILQIQVGSRFTGNHLSTDSFLVYNHSQENGINIKYN